MLIRQRREIARLERGTRAQVDAPRAVPPPAAEG